MTAAGPWSVKGIDPKAREMAKDLARRSGMTLGEWLNQMIIDGGDGDMAPAPPFDDPAPPIGQRQAGPRTAPLRPDPRQPSRRRLLDEMYREATFARKAEAERLHEGAGRRIPERGYRDASPGSFHQADAGLAELGWPDARAAQTTTFGRGDEPELGRITQALEALSARLETAEHRSTLAISGIDQSVMGVLSRLDSMDEGHGQTAARLEGAIDQVRETQARVAERVRRMEHEDGSRIDALRALESALSRLAGQINESTQRADAAAAQVHEDVDQLGRRINKIEAGADATAALLDGASKTRDDLDDISRRMEAVESAVAYAPDAYADAEKVETVLARIAERLERAEARTTAAVRSLETSFAGLDARLRTSETRSRDADTSGEIDRRFQSLAVELSKKVDASRAEFAERLRGVADAAKPDAAKLGTLETALRDLTGQVAQSEQRSAQAIDRIGREVVTIAHSLGERVAGVEARSTAAVEQMGGEMARISDTIDSRLKRADTTQAEALEKLGGEIARIAERLTERIAASDRRAAETLDAAAGRFSRLTSTLSDKQDQTATELTDRIRQSEERTAKLLGDTREKLEQQALELQRKTMVEVALRTAEAVPAPAPYVHSAPPPVADFEPANLQRPDRVLDWRAETAAGVPADPFASTVGHDPQTPADVHEDPFAAPRPAYPPPHHADEAQMIEEPPIDGLRMDGTLSELVGNLFDPDDDFQAPLSSSTHFGPPFVHSQAEASSASGVDSSDTDLLEPNAFEADSFEADLLEPDSLEFGAFGQQSGHDFIVAPEPERPNPTREMLDQARAAAKRAAGGRDSFKTNAIPAPGLDGAETKPFGISFSSKTKKAGAGSTLRTVGLASGWACAITCAAVGAYSIAVKDGGGQGREQGRSPVAEAPTAAAPATPEAEPQSTKPQLAMALAPPPASSPGAPSGPAGAVSKAAAALKTSAKPAEETAGAAPKPPSAEMPQTPVSSAPLAANPAAPGDKAANAVDTARSLYDESVRRIETGDAGAVNDLKRAANLGFAPAQFYLGRLYEAGAAGLAKDMGEARRWTQRAAQGGDPAAMYNLASYLYAGDGGSKDPAGAVEWFRKAAERGVVNSQYNLAQLYETGHGVTKNLAEAYKWYLVAAAAGDPEAKANVQTLRAQMPADTRASVEKAAAALRIQFEGPSHIAAVPGAASPR